jgi:prepilin-type N-terminal cleavage/methylation domain-containing protein
VRRLRGEESGYSLVELVIVMAIMGTVLAAISAMFVTGIHAQSDLDNRFQAQVNLNTAISKLRREVHNACGISAGYTTSVITLQMPTSNPPPQPPNTPCTAPTLVTWCTSGSGSRYKLWRVPGVLTCATATAGARPYADYVTNSGPFTSYTAANIPQSQLGKLHVHFVVAVKPSAPSASLYALDDDLIMRNSAT